MEEYEEDDESTQIESKRVDKDNACFWQTMTVPAEIELYFLKYNQFHFGQSEHKSTPFTTESMKEKFN